MQVIPLHIFSFFNYDASPKQSIMTEGGGVVSVYNEWLLLGVGKTKKLIRFFVMVQLTPEH